MVASGLYDLKHHFKTALHKYKLEIKKGASIKTFFAQPQQEADSITRAEVLFTNFVAQHNLAASIADHFCDLAVVIFPDSAIAKKFSSKRTKTTLIIKKCLAPSATDRVINLCREMPFSLMTDESNDKKTDKRLAIRLSV